MAASSADASGHAEEVAYPALTHADKKRYANQPSLLIPLGALATEFRLRGEACHDAKNAVKNCKHNVHCVHGLGVQRKGIWDGWTTGAPKRPAWLQLLGPNPHDRALDDGNRVGLQNLGATCYLNTLFQFLFMDPLFRNVVYQYEAPPSLPSESPAALTIAKAAAAEGDGVAAEPPPTSGGIAYLHHMQQVFTHLEHSATYSYNPAHIVNALHMNQHEQQDVHEFLNLLVFQVLDRELQQSLNPICRQLIPKLFTGQTVHVMEGQSCKHQSERLSEFHDLSSIQIKGKKKLEECLDEYFREELMYSEKIEHRWKCGTCNQRENAIRHTYLKDPPPVLILQLGRFEFDSTTFTKKKLGDAIKLPKRLDLSKYIQPPKGAPQTAAAAPVPASADASASPVAASASPAAAPMDIDEEPPVASKKRGAGARRGGTKLAPQVEDSVRAAVAAVEAATKVADLTPSKRKRGPAKTDETPAPPSSLDSLRVHDQLPSPPAPRGRKPAAGKPTAAKRARGKKGAAAEDDADAAQTGPIDLTEDVMMAAQSEQPISEADGEALSIALAQKLATEDQPRGPGRRPRKAAQAADEDIEEISAPAAKQQKTTKGQTAGSGPKSRGAGRPKKAPAAADAATDDAEIDTDLVTESSLDPSGANVYELVAILLHKGPSANRGHYTAEIKDQVTGQWFAFDDSKVTHKGIKKKLDAIVDDANATATTANAEAAEAAEPATVGSADAPEIIADTDEPMEDASAAPAAPATPAADPAESPTEVAAAAASDVEIIETTAPARRGNRQRRPSLDSIAASAVALPAVSDKPAKRARKPVVAIDAAEPPKRKAKKTLEELDDEENGDEESYDPKAKPKAKRGTKDAKEKAPAKPKAGKADVSASAASTAYILIYRRCNTMQPGWHPFTDEEMAQLTAATPPVATPDAAEAASALTPVSAAPVASIPSPAVTAALLASQSPALLLAPVQVANAAFKAEIAHYDERHVRLTAAAEARRTEIDALLDVITPSDFQTVAAAIGKVAPPPPRTPPTPVTPKLGGKPEPRQSARRASRTKEADAAMSDTSAPSTPVVVDLTTVQMGHYVSTQWLSAYLTGWVIDKEEAAAAAAPAADEAKDETKEESKEPEDLDDDEPMKDESDQAAPAVPASPSAASVTAADDKSPPEGGDEQKSSTPAPTPAAPSHLTPLQAFLKAHPDNDDLPWPSDLLDSLETLKCKHGKLNPTKMQSAKRISCAAWKILYNANQAWREKQQRAQIGVKAEDVPMKIECKTECKSESRSNSPAVAASSAAAACSSPASSSSSSLQSPVCVLETCNLAGLTDADLCQECARETLLGETMLKEQHEKHMAVYNAYLVWDEQQRKAEEKNDGQTTFDRGFVVSNAWWKVWKRELDAVAKALGITTIVKKKATKAGSGPSAAALAAQQQKPLPKLSTMASATEDICCEHGRLVPGASAISVSKAVWVKLLDLYPASEAVKIDGLDEAGNVLCCPVCQEANDAKSDEARAKRDTLKAEKGKLKFIKTISHYYDFPVHSKAPLEGIHHLMPTSWARKLHTYFQGTGPKPGPMSTKELLCKHGKLLYTPYPEEDKSILPVVAAALAASASSAAASPAAVTPISLISKVNSTPVGELSICDDAEYDHLKSQNWIDTSSADITIKVSKNVRNVTGDLSSWTRVHVNPTPKPCEECIQARLDSEKRGELDFEDEELILHRLQPDEKVEDDHAIAVAMQEGRRASTRKKASTRPRKPVQVTASSSDTVYTLKLKIFEECSMDINHQDVIWVQESGNQVTLSDANRTLRSYNLPPDAELRLKLNATGTQDLYEQMQSKGGVEHGFKGTALSSSHVPAAATASAAAPSATTPPPTAASPAAAAAAAPTSSANDETMPACESREAPEAPPQALNEALEIPCSPTYSAHSSPVHLPLPPPAVPMEIDEELCAAAAAVPGPILSCPSSPIIVAASSAPGPPAAALAAAAPQPPTLPAITATAALDAVEQMAAQKLGECEHKEATRPIDMVDLISDGESGTGDDSPSPILPLAEATKQAPPAAAAAAKPALPPFRLRRLHHK